MVNRSVMQSAHQGDYCLVQPSPLTPSPCSWL